MHARGILESLRRGARVLTGWAALTLGLPVAVGVALVLRGDASPAELTRDMAAEAGVDPWWGMLGSMGVLYLIAGAAICAFTAVVLADWDRRGRVGASVFLLATSLFLAVVSLDDLFMVHEEVIPRLLGLPERAVVLAYGVAGVGYVAVFRSRYVGNARLFGAAALLWIVLSVVLDAVTGGGSVETVVEDLAKFAGFSLLLLTMVVLCLPLVRGEGRRTLLISSTPAARGVREL